MRTIEDIRNPARVSGFSGVRVADDGRQKKPYQAEKRIAPTNPDGSEAGTRWQGPRRATAEEAAQDYCDYVNGNDVQTAATLKFVGHVTRSNPRDLSEAEVAARKILRDARAEREGRPGYVYLVGEESPYIHGVGAVKIGYSVDPQARVGELQTGNPRPLKLMATIKGTPEKEAELHSRFSDHNMVGEWFQATLGVLDAFGLRA